jgi:hypothetical protein
MMENPKRCTDSLEKALGYVDEIIYGDKSIKLTKDIANHVFSLSNPLHGHSFSIKCYITNNLDIRFCVDRGADCVQPRTMTNFLIIRNPSEIHVIDSGKP